MPEFVQEDEASADRPASSGENRRHAARCGDTVPRFHDGLQGCPGTQHLWASSLCRLLSWPQQIVRTSERLRWPSNRCVNVPKNLKSWHPIEDFRMVLTKLVAELEG